MKKLLAICSFLLAGSLAYAQSDISISEYLKLDGKVKDGIQNLTDGLHGGLNALEWQDGSGAKAFRIGVMVYSGFGSVAKSPEIGLNEDLFFPSLGGQVNLGTMGAEVFVRMFPEFDSDGFKYGSFGIGAKYDITDFIPVTGFPSTSVYASYSSFSVSVTNAVDINGTENIEYQGGTYPATYSTTLDGTMEIAASSFSVGAISSFDFFVGLIFARAALEFGSSEISWNGAEPNTNDVSGDPINGFTIGTKPFDGGEDFGNTGLRLGIGMSLFGLKGEVGIRNGTYMGVGYGITF